MDSPSTQASKPQRVLACVLCQQRKVKCDRKFPCAHCLKSRVQCVPATLTPRRRRHRLPERALLGRLRKYEDLLRNNGIIFEPFHEGATREEGPPDLENSYDFDEEHPEAVGTSSNTPSTTIESDRGYRAKDLWQSMNQGFQDCDTDSSSPDNGLSQTSLKKAWAQSVENDDNLLFGSRRMAVDLSTFQPSPAQIFKFWQVYLDNVNPLLKVTHTPSLQARIIDAISNTTTINPALEALMFSIYCISILSLTGEQCQTMFVSSKEDLLTRYRFGCQQALLNCEFLRSSDRDCLTALYLYLVSVMSSTVPQSLSCLLGVAVRIAQRMGIHSESTLTKCNVLEAEMRRRLWWSLVLFDNRIGEIAGFRNAPLDPTWDCKIPLNVNDSDLWQEMKGPPAVQGRPTEALFIAVRSELGELIRHSTFHLHFTNPALKLVAKHHQDVSVSDSVGLAKLEQTIEEQYLESCDEENPLHFVTIWVMRGQFAKYHLLEHYSRCSDPLVRRTEEQHDIATSHALRILECDTKITSSPLTKGFRWLNRLHFPLPAYMQITQDLRRRPFNKQARLAWEVMSDNYEPWLHSFSDDFNPFLQIFNQIILYAWEAYEAAYANERELLAQPRIVSSIKHASPQTAQHTSNTETEQQHTTMGMETDNFSMPTNFFNGSSMPNMGMLDASTVVRPDIYSGTLGQAPLDVHTNSWDWNIFYGQPGWGNY